MAKGKLKSKVRFNIKKMNDVESVTHNLAKHDLQTPISRQVIGQLDRRQWEENGKLIKEARKEQAELRKKRFLRERDERRKTRPQPKWKHTINDSCPMCETALEQGKNYCDDDIMFCPAEECGFTCGLKKYLRIKEDVINQHETSNTEKN